MKKMCIILSTLFAAISCGGQEINNTPVSSLSLDRYLGNWYEIARFNHSFEKGIERAEANYSLETNGTIKVINTGFKNGKFRNAEGRAKLTKTPGLLRVSFFGPFYSDYRVLMLSENYEYALVGSRNSKYLWILSRTPSLPDDTIEIILNQARRRGYQTEKLIWVNQE